MSLNTTPIANRIHIAIFGKMNCGKSSLINALTRQEIAIVSDVAGTTTDPVSKPMEVPKLGACVIIDTAGFDDTGKLGKLRAGKTKSVMDKTDIAVVIFSGEDIAPELAWCAELEARQIPFVLVISKCDTDISATVAACEKAGIVPVLTGAKTKFGIGELLEKIAAKLPDNQTESITGHLVKPGDTVVLVMPQDESAPKGRLILPQVQTIRDLLDSGCTAICVTPETLDGALSSLANPPELIIVDSQVFAAVYPKVPEQTRLTSFSVLFARQKGDVEIFISGAKAIANLKDGDSVLIAEACTHAPQDGDIARVKIPNLLSKTTGKNLNIEWVSGVDFPEVLAKYALIIHCGGCMMSRKFVMTRIERAAKNGVPITNYGIAIAYMNGILEKIDV